MLVIIPAYNEAKNIPSLLKQIFFLGLNLSVLIVDDNSPDGTSEEVKKQQSKYPHLYLLKRSGKRGLASAYIEGFKYALEKGYEIIIQMDADLSHSPSCIPNMLRLLITYDLVIGSRYIEKGGVSNWTFTRLLLSRLANVFSKILLHIPINDLTSGFKCMRKTVLEDIDFPTITPKGYVFQIEMVYRAFLKGFKIVEYPIIFKERKDGISKVTTGIAIEAFFRVIFLSLTKMRMIFQKAKTKERKRIMLLLLCLSLAGLGIGGASMKAEFVDLLTGEKFDSVENAKS